MDDIQTFHRQFLVDIQGGADAEGIIPVEAFLENGIELLTEAGEIDEGSRSYFEGKYKRKALQVDGYGGDPKGASNILSLIICDFSASSEIRTIRSAELKPIFSKLSEFLIACRKNDFRESLEETSEGYALADLVSKRWNSIEKIKLILLSNADNRAKVDARDAGTIDEKPVTYNVWDLKRLQKYMEQGQAREDLEINFKTDFGGSIPLLRASGSAASLESYLAVIPGKQLSEIYGKWGARLLESNVRSFLQARGKVNQGIRRTIAEEPYMFLAYNNGISATADTVEIEKTIDGLVMTSVNNLQIVNGGQTTASIFAASKTSPENLNDVFVQMKLSIVPQDKSEEVVPRISEYANSQNKVNAADFFANHPFHVRMEEFSRRLLAPAGINGLRETKWFYERARGQYADQRSGLSTSVKKMWDAEYPRSQFFTKTDLAKYTNTFQCKPHIVSLGAQKNFSDFASGIGKRWGEIGHSFDEIWFRRLVAQAIVFRRMEKLVSASSWYEGGYRANIVTYGIAKLVHDTIESGPIIDLDHIWRIQDVPEALVQALMVSGAEAQSIILDPQAVRNIGEWAKKQACWKILSDAELNYGDDFASVLIDPEDVRSATKLDRRDLDIDEGIAKQTRVIELGSTFWAEALDWGAKKRAFSPKESGILLKCTHIPNSFPSERQCELAIKALNKIVGLGFTHSQLEAN